jgi:di/tricarboxylate transporter
MSAATVSLVVLAVTIALFIWNRLPPEVVALGSAIALFATGVLEVDQIFAGFGDQVILFVATLFVISEGLNATGVTTWAGRLLMKRTATSSRLLLLTAMVLGALLAALISVNGAVATLLPMVVLIAVKLRYPPSRLAMPLAFAGHAGSLLTLAGTPVNLIVSEAAARDGARPFGFLEFALVGVPLVIGTVTIAVLSSGRLLPERTPRSMPPDLSQYGRTLTQQYLHDGSSYLRVRRGSPFAGSATSVLVNASKPGLVVVGATTEDGSPRGDNRLRSGDLLMVRGSEEDIDQFARTHDLERVAPDSAPSAGALVDRELGVAEVLVPPRSPLVGDKVFPGMTADNGDLVLLAVHRKGHDLGSGQAVLTVGDILLMQGPWQALGRGVDESTNVLAVHNSAVLRRQTVVMGRGARPALVILGAMVVMLATGVVPPGVAGLLAVGAMVLFRVVTLTEAYASISWTTLVVVAGMFPLSAALEQTGAARQIADVVVSAVGGDGTLLLLGLFVMTALLGQVISNMATALVVIPVAVSAAHDVGVATHPVLMCVAIAAAASFMSPIATTANLMVMEPGGYRFGDYWKFGLPMLLWFLLVAVFLVPVFWPL